MMIYNLYNFVQPFTVHLKTIQATIWLTFLQSPEMSRPLKAQERLHLGFSKQYIIDGPATRQPNDFSLFHATEQNKKQLCQMLLQVWGSDMAASRFAKCGTAVLVVEGKAYHLCFEHSKTNIFYTAILLFCIFICLSLM